MPESIDSSVFLGFEDLRGEGFDPVLDRITGYGATGVTVAAAYHRARDLTPHGSPRVTVRHDGVHFEPDPALFEGLRLRPPVQPRAEEEPLRQLRLETAVRGIALHGWTVFCHNSTLGTAHPECTTENAFGGYGSPADLCPAQPDVQAYVLALARNVAAHHVDTVVAESLHFGSFDHGYHHERSFVRLGGIDNFLLGLCFCPSCLDVAAVAGIDAREARLSCRRVLEAVFDAGEANGGEAKDDEVTVENLEARVGSELAAYAVNRTQTVSALVGLVSDAVAEFGSRLVFLDVTGARKGYRDGHPKGRPAAEDSWQLGIDPVELEFLLPGYSVLAYASDSERVATDVAAYREAIGPDVELRAVLRPSLPDTISTESLAEKAIAAVQAGADAIDFYHYGLAPLQALDRIPAALRAATHAAGVHETSS
jgi:hypothetical protein